MSKNSNKPLENTLVWSAHQTKALGSCPRQYYYAYIGGWEGWNSDAAPERQAAYRLKNLTTPEMEIGQIVHRQIRVIFEKARHGLTVSPATEVKIAQELFRMFDYYSRGRDLETLSAKNRKFLLHELGGVLTNNEITKYVEKIGSYLDHFFQFVDVQHLLANPTVLIPEFLDVPGFEVGYELDVPARLRTDAVFVTADRFVVADWKACDESLGKHGRPEHREQALVYDLFVRKKVGLSSTEKVDIRFYYLGSGKVEIFEFNDEERAEKLWQCGEDFADLSRYSDDPKINTAPEERFRPHVSSACFRCNFQQLCPGFLQSRLHREGTVGELGDQTSGKRGES
jgi:hypothetical protein